MNDPDPDDDIVFVEEKAGPARTTIVDAPSVDEKERARLFGAAMRVMYIRYVRRRPEDVLEEKRPRPGWRNLAVWNQNSCHVDVALDVVLWGGMWRAAGNDDGEKAYDHVEQEYREMINSYAKKRLTNSSGASRDRDSIRTRVCINTRTRRSRRTRRGGTCSITTTTRTGPCGETSRN